MLQNRVLWAGVMLAVGVLQAWDSNALQAGSFLGAIVALGILTPSMAIAATTDRPVRIAALLVGAILLTWARMRAPVTLNTLHLAIFPAAIYILFVAGWDRVRTAE